MESKKYVLNGVRNETCPTRIMLSAIEGKWKMLLIYHLFNGRKRPGELEKLISDAKRQVLMQHLKELETDGLVGKEVFAEVPLRVEYFLTPRGAELEPVFRMMYNWGQVHAPDIYLRRGLGAEYEINCFDTAGITST